MNSTRHPARVVLALLALVAVPALADAGPLGPNLIQNGSFETGDFSSWTTSGTCEFVLPALGVLSQPSPCGGVAFNSGLLLKDPTPTDGLYSAHIGKGSADVLSQSVTTTPSGLYDVAFSFANTTATSGFVNPDDTLKAYFDGVLIMNWKVTGPSGIDTYSTFHITGLQASGSSALLSFVSNRNSAYFDIDNVSVNQQVPEPTTLALFGVGLAGAGGRRWWQRRKSSKQYA